jgi:hypothetical protein
VQAGLGYRPGEHRAYQTGETVRLVVRLRNVGKKEVKFSYFNEFFYENPPAVADGGGKPVPLEGAGLSGLPVLVERNLAPGKEVKICEMSLELKPASERDKERPVWKLFGTGKFQLQIENVGGGNIGTGEIKFDPVLNKLATGKLELEVKDAERLPEKREKKEAFAAWGKEVGGLQAGLGFRPGEHRAYHHGETATVVLRVRNVGKEAVEFKHIWAFFVENPPTITDADSKTVELPKFRAEGLQAPRSTNVAPGKEVELYEWKFDLQPKGGINKELFTIHGTGKFSLHCERVVGPTSGNPTDPNPTLGKLATGKLDLEVKDAQNQPVQQEKEAFTAWGKEAGGLQAGLGLRPGERRAYHHGETVTLVVRVRNVGKEAVRFEYLRQFLDENPPTVTGADGKTVPQVRLEVLGEHGPVEVTLGPGKEIELESRMAGGARLAGASGLRYGLGPALGTGKVGFQYERVFGNSSAGSIKLDPALSKLATGKLELEITPDPPPAAIEKK